MAESLPKISIIVPVYNVAEYLPQCLDSLVNQTYPNIEIICVNDGSTDNSAGVLNCYEKEHHNLIVFHQDNNGVSSARNLGIQKATGAYVMFVDSDDWIELNTCEELLGEALKNKMDIVMCGYIKEYGEKQIQVHIFDHSFMAHNERVRELQRRLFGPIGTETANPQDLDIMISPCMQLFNKSLLENVFFPDINEYGTFEDGLFQISVYGKCQSFQYIDKCKYHYRKTNITSITTRYKEFLPEQFDKLYLALERIIAENDYSIHYNTALNNRIIFGLIGLSLNEIRSNSGVLKKSKRLKQIVSTQRYQDSFESYDTLYLNWKWKVFFWLLRAGLTFPVVIMLETINYLRR